MPPEGRGKRNHDDLTAWLIRKGKLQLEMADGSKLDAGVGDWVFVPPGTRFQDFSPGACLLSLSWRAKWPDGRSLFSEGLPLKIRSSESRGLEQSAQRLLAHARQHIHLDYGSIHQMKISSEVYLKSERLLFNWLETAIRILAKQEIYPSVHQAGDERVAHAQQIIQRLPLQHPFRDEELARQTGLSRSQLNRLFSIHVRHTPREQFEQRRLAEARRLLRMERMPIKEISFHLGFSSQTRFHEWFRRVERISPSAYRREEHQTARVNQNPVVDKSGKENLP